MYAVELSVVITFKCGNGAPSTGSRIVKYSGLPRSPTLSRRRPTASHSLDLDAGLTNSTPILLNVAATMLSLRYPTPSASIKGAASLILDRAPFARPIRVSAVVRLSRAGSARPTGRLATVSHVPSRGADLLPLTQAAPSEHARSISASLSRSRRRNESTRVVSNPA